MPGSPCRDKFDELRLGMGHNVTHHKLQKPRVLGDSRWHLRARAHPPHNGAGIRPPESSCTYPITFLSNSSQALLKEKVFEGMGKGVQA